mgnify:CR=1 FL=1|jgi:hypothetical protein|tara:strand:- start:5558 stop:5758 length:201 start_codon:yes stop_codon:yes gene_type:complete
MGLLNWITGNSIDRENTVVVKTLKSKGRGKAPINITVDDIKHGVAVDVNGYHNEVVLFLRKNKKDR